MPAPRQFLPAAPADAFARLRTELELPDGFPAEVEAAAAAAVAAGPRGERVDATDLPLVTVDPPGSRDLDQALFVERRGSGLRAHYAIADLAAFVSVGDPVDREARARGRTVYLPDGTVPLHPRVLSEQAASLLPGVDRPALLWQVDLDDDGVVLDSRLRRATVRSRAQLDYQQAQHATARPNHPAALLLELGRRRQELEWVRGGVSLDIADQRVELVDGEPVLHLRRTLPIEAANAQLSLLVGQVAADTMVAAGVGLLRTLPPSTAEQRAALRADAHALGAPWPADVDVATFLRTLHGGSPRDAALLVAATRTLRGAGYQHLVFGQEPQVHAAVAAHYAHVTAPLRRLVDRYAHEVLLAVTAGRDVPDDVAAVLPDVPGEMQAGGSRAAAAERATTDLAEALLLADRVGEVLRGVALRHVADDRTQVRLVDPPVLGTVATRLPLGAEVPVRVAAVDVVARSVTLAPSEVGNPAGPGDVPATTDDGERTG